MRNRKLQADGEIMRDASKGLEISLQNNLWAMNPNMIRRPLPTFVECQPVASTLAP